MTELEEFAYLLSRHPECISELLRIAADGTCTGCKHWRELSHNDTTRACHYALDTGHCRPRGCSIDPQFRAAAV